jgi:hypothetical protein
MFRARRLAGNIDHSVGNVLLKYQQGDSARRAMIPKRGDVAVQAVNLVIFFQLQFPQLISEIVRLSRTYSAVEC